jgi:methylenetetrahydrofolate reductase (NADPH)
METEHPPAADPNLAGLLRGYSAEVTSADRKSIEAAAASMPPGSEVYIASLPSDKLERTISVARELKQAGLTPVPHIVARNIPSLAHLDDLLRRLTREAGVDRTLVLGGDRSEPAGELHSSLQLLESGLWEVHGIRNIALAWYPEGHPRISDSALRAARAAKLQRAAAAALQVKFVSQFCFESAPIIASARELRAEGVTAPLRIGVAGPASRTSLLKYAMICGVGASVRALSERPGTGAMLRGDTPEALLEEIAAAQSLDPALTFEGVHFFTFASLAATVKFVAEHSRGRATA